MNARIPDESLPPQAAIQADFAARQPSGRLAAWSIVAVALLLVIASVGGYFYQRQQAAMIGSENLRLIVTGPSSVQAGVAAEYSISTTAIGGEPLPAQVEVAVLATDGKPVMAHNERADESGRLRFLIPGDLDLPPRPRLKVVARHGASGAEMESPLAVESQIYVAQREWAFSIRSYGLPQAKNESLGQPRPLTSDKVDVTFYPEGGALVPDLENRVYFIARDPQGHRLPLSGTIIAKGRGEDTEDEDVAIVETIVDGMGSFSIIPHFGEKYRLKITQPSGVTNEPILPGVSSQCDVALSAGVGVAEAGKPLQFVLRATKAGFPLVAAVYCRGALVGQEPLVTKAGVNPAAISLDPAAVGPLRLVVYDYSATPPKPVAQRLVYRRPASDLKVQALGLKPRYSPGEAVDLTLLVTDRNSTAASSILSVTVVNEALFSTPEEVAADRPAELVPHDDATTPDLAESKLSLPGDNYGGTPSAVALDLLLATQPFPPQENAATQPPLVLDNLNELIERREQGLAARLAGQDQLLDAVVILGFLGGTGLVLLVVMSGLMRTISGMYLRMAALATIVGLLVNTVMLFGPGPRSISRNMPVAFAPYNSSMKMAAAGVQPSSPPPKPPAIFAAPYSYRRGQPAAKDGPVETLFWNPMLQTGPDGKAAIHFDLPDAAATYRVRINAQSAGRLGAGHAEIVVRGK